MRTHLTSLLFVEVLSNQSIISTLALSMFQTLYAFEGHKASASEVSKIIGTKGHAPLNSEIGRLAKRIGKHYDIGVNIRENGTYRWWDLFFNGWDEAGLFIWQLRPELVLALEETGLTGVVQLAEEVSETDLSTLTEGAVRRIMVNAYERNPVARRRCIQDWGYACSVCELEMESMYGILGKEFIHVHHITPISSKGKVSLVDAVKDLRPVCPNCHSIIHQSNPPLSIEEVRAIVSALGNTRQ